MVWYVHDGEKCIPLKVLYFYMCKNNFAILYWIYELVKSFRYDSWKFDKLFYTILQSWTYVSKFYIEVFDVYLLQIRTSFKLSPRKKFGGQVDFLSSVEQL